MITEKLEFAKISNLSFDFNDNDKNLSSIFVSGGEYDGIPMTESQLDLINNKYFEFIVEKYYY